MKYSLIALLAVLLLAACKKKEPELTASGNETVYAGAVPASARYVPYVPTMSIIGRPYAAGIAELPLAQDCEANFECVVYSGSSSVTWSSGSGAYLSVPPGAEVGVRLHHDTIFTGITTDTNTYVGVDSIQRTEITITNWSSTWLGGRIGAPREIISSYGLFALDAGAAIQVSSPWKWSAVDAILRHSTGGGQTFTSYVDSLNTTIYHVDSYSTTKDYWQIGQRGYVPIRVAIDGGWRYGWIELELESGNTLVVHGHALHY